MNTATIGYVVSVDKEKLDKAPRYADVDVPAYASDYTKRVDSYYGIGWF